MLDNANSFYRACEILNSSNTIEEIDYGTIMNETPTIVNLALTCELFLKYLLSEDRQSEIKQKLLEHIDENDIDDNLSILGKVFEDWRYIYEHNPDRHKVVSLTFIEYFSNILFEVCNN